MKAVIQRVSSACVRVDNQTVGSCGIGLLILLGVEKGDTEKDAQLLADKIGKLRIFSDENDKLNLSVTDVSGSALVVSNFTLCANYKKGNRPDYLNSEAPDRANELYMFFSEKLSEYVKVENGVFGADMKIELVNDGPITIVMESSVLVGKNN